MPTETIEYLIRTPNENYTSPRNGPLGLEFVHGKTITLDPWVANRARHLFGFTVMPDPPVFITTKVRKGEATHVLVDPPIHELLVDHDALDLLPEEYDGVWGADELRAALKEKGKDAPIPAEELEVFDEPEDQVAEPVEA